MHMPKPLEGVVVLDVTHVVAGPFCTMLLANAGAEVIKVEPPTTGERSRSPGLDIPGGPREPVSLQYVRVNRGKKGITLNLRHEEGRLLFIELAKKADVVVENFRPGAMRKLGLDYETLKALCPTLIYATISGFGRRDDLRGPYSDWAANNPSIQAMSGLMDVTGDRDGPPVLMGASIGDTVPGLWAAYAIMLALQHRRATGAGQHVDVAMYDCMVVHNDTAVPFYDLTKVSPGRRREDMWSPQLRLAASDGYVVLSGTANPRAWARLWQAAGRDDLAKDDRYLGHKVDGPFFLDSIGPALEAWSKTKPREYVTRLARDFGFSAGVVQTAAEVYACPHLEARSMYSEFEFLGHHFRQPGDPVKLSNVPGKASARPPRLGEHNEEILCGLLGLAEEDVEALYAKGVCSRPSTGERIDQPRPHSSAERDAPAGTWGP